MSVLTNLRGFSLLSDTIMAPQAAYPVFASQTIDAAAERIAMIGTVWDPLRSSANFSIRKVHFRCGSPITFASGSVMRVSLQDVSATAGPPYQPDGTQDQYFDWLGSTGLTAGGWNVTGNLTADRSVAQGELLSVVWEFQTFTAADSILISSLGTVGTLAFANKSQRGGQSLFFNGTSWASQYMANNIVLEKSDGTYAFLNLAYPFVQTSSATISSTGAIRRAGAYFSVPVQMKIDGLYLGYRLPNAADGNLILYDGDGSTELLNVAVDNDRDVLSGTTEMPGMITFAPITLAAGTGYRFVYVAGGTTANQTVGYADVNAAGMLDALPLGSDCYWTQHDGTAWAQTTTRRPYFGLSIAAVHDGLGGAGYYQRVRPL